MPNTLLFHGHPGRSSGLRGAISSLALAISLVVPGPGAAAGGSGASPDGPASGNTRQLDMKKVHDEYQDGNFDAVLADLEGYQRAHSSFRREDSIFIAKHLAVVYSANPGTREKGRYYMNRLLELMPSAKLVDMYVSDEIDRIFEKVREEFLSRQQGFGVDPSTVRLPDRATGDPQAAPQAGGGTGADERSRERKAGTGGKSGGKTWIWVAGGACIAGAAAYYIFHDTREPDKTYVVQ